MGSDNGSTPERRQRAEHSVRNWPCAGISHGNQEKLSLDRLAPYQRQEGTVVPRRYAWPIVLCCVGLLLWLTWYIPYWFPKWHTVPSRLFAEHAPFAITLSASLIFLLFWCLLWKLPQRQVVAVPEMKDRIDLESKSRQTLAQILGGAALLVGLYFTSQTLRTTQEGQITDRFTKAIDQLGNDNLAVRLGGIYALERIARDSEADHGPVMEVLTAFVRVQRSAQRLPGNTPEQEKAQQALELLHEKGFDAFREAVFARIQEEQLRADIQVILTVLGRRTKTYGKGESQRLNLQFTNLQYADLQGAQLQGAMLEGVQLQRAKGQGAQLQHTLLSGAELQNATLNHVKLQEADLKWANLEGAYLIYAELQKARLDGARLQNAIFAHAQLQGADLQEAKDLTQDQINRACVDENTLLPAGLTKPPPCPANP